MVNILKLMEYNYFSLILTSYFNTYIVMRCYSVNPSTYLKKPQACNLIC